MIPYNTLKEAASSIGTVADATPNQDIDLNKFQNLGIVDYAAAFDGANKSSWSPMQGVLNAYNEIIEQKPQPPVQTGAVAAAAQPGAPAIAVQSAGMPPLVKILLIGGVVYIGYRFYKRGSK
jgi:hypothetical protein